MIRGLAGPGPGGLAQEVRLPGPDLELAHDAVAAPLEPVRDVADLALVRVDGVDDGELPVGHLAAEDLDPVDLVDLRLGRGGPRFCGFLGHQAVSSGARAGRPGDGMVSDSWEHP